MRIFSMDLGSTTIAVYYGDLDTPNPEPKPLLRALWEPAGFARRRDGTLLLGQQLFQLDSLGFSRVRSISIDLKAIPGPENHGMMVEYAAALLAYVRGQCPALFREEPERRAYWFIGAPTGWRDPAVLEEYRQIFVEAGYENPVIALESNAAMALAEQTYLAVSRMNPALGALCLDLGGYSNDATYLLPNQVSSSSSYVGAALIEQMLLELNLEGRFRQNKKEHNPPDLREAAAEKCRSDPAFRSYLLLHMRRLKEAYFNAVAAGRLVRKDMVETVELEGLDPRFLELDAESFVLYVNDEMVNAAVREIPIRAVLGERAEDLPRETREEMGGRTWSGCLEAFLQRTMAQCPALAEAAAGKGERPAVILTGGAALMPFVEETLLELLPNVDLYKDQAPATTISRGLWYFGPKKLRAMEFDRAFDQILRETDGEGKGVLNEILSRAHDVLGAGTNHTIAVQAINCIVDATVLWKKHALNSAQIIPRARADFEAWFNGARKQRSEQCAAECKDYIVREINGKFASFLQDSGVEDTEILKKDELKLEYVDSLFERYMEQIFQVLDQVLAEEQPLYTQLHNPGWLQSMLLVGRSMILSAVSKDLNQHNRELFETMHDEFLKKLYDSDEIYRPFVAECLKEIQGALLAKKWALLGGFIVEETPGRR